jgi:diguanylate cyclase (GGDEF)-like protein/PAS domain S-box-containing protein
VVGELWLPDATAAALERTARWSLASDSDLALAAHTAAMTFSPGVGLPGEVWASGVPVWWRPVAELTATLRAVLTDAGIAGAFACPIVSEQTTLGVLVFLSDELRPPDEELQATLLAIGQQFGRFLEHRRAEAALHATHQRLDFHVQNAPLSVVEWGADLRIHRWSAEAEHLFGWSAEEIVGRLVGDWPFVHVDDEALVAPMISDLLSGWADRNLQRNRNYTKAGSVVYIEWHNSVLRDPDGTLVSVMSLGLDITERVRLQERLTHQALHDPLTGLPNRALVLERLEQEVARATRRGTSAAVLFLDLDGFKAANDRLGHAAGDEVLITVAARLRAHLRGDDTVARLGGDEFVVILAAPTEPQEAIVVAERLRAAIAQPLTLAAGEAIVGTSIGIALSTPDCANPEALLAAADAAMYQAKGAGKGRYALATT